MLGMDNQPSSDPRSFNYDPKMKKSAPKKSAPKKGAKKMVASMKGAKAPKSTAKKGKKGY